LLLVNAGINIDEECRNQGLVVRKDQTTNDFDLIIYVNF